MKKLLLLFTFAFFLFTFSLSVDRQAFSQEYGWNDISSNIPDFPFDTTIINNNEDTLIANFTDVFFINDNEGWVTTWHGYDSDSAAILHTDDGGNTWEVQIVGRACNVIWMLDGQTGYAGSQAGGIIYKTTDGGNNWNYHGNTGKPVTDISFAPGSDTGYVCSDMSYNFHKITKNEVTATYTGLPEFWKGVAHTSNNIWFCGGGSIYKWEGETLISVPCNNHGSFQSLYFQDAQHGWAGDQDFIQGYVASDDIFVVTKVTDDVMISGLHAIDKDHLWACLFEGQILYTSNAYDFGYENSTGWTDVIWESQPHPKPDARWDEIFFTSLSNGYVVGNRKSIMKYTEVSGIEEEAEELKFELYPNPAVSVISLQSAVFSQESATIEITDMQGRKLLEKQIKSGSETIKIDVSNLASGVYFCRLISENKSATQKLIIQK